MYKTGLRRQFLKIVRVTIILVNVHNLQTLVHTKFTIRVKSNTLVLRHACATEHALLYTFQATFQLPYFSHGFSLPIAFYCETSLLPTRTYKPRRAQRTLTTLTINCFTYISALLPIQHYYHSKINSTLLHKIYLANYIMI